MASQPGTSDMQKCIALLEEGMGSITLEKSKTSASVSANNDGKIIKLIMDGKVYSVDTTKMPYFSAWQSFESHQDKSTVEEPTQNLPSHKTIPFFETALLCVKEGFRCAFKDNSLGTDLDKYRSLIDTLKFLCVDILAGNSLEDISKDVRITSWKNNVDMLRRCRPLRYQIRHAQDAAFRLLCLIIEGSPGMKSNLSANHAYNTVEFIASHSLTFPQVIQEVLKRAYLLRFVVTAKQRAKLERNDDDLYVDTSESNDESSDYYELELSGHSSYDSDY